MINKRSCLCSSALLRRDPLSFCRCEMARPNGKSRRRDNVYSSLSLSDGDTRRCISSCMKHSTAPRLVRHAHGAPLVLVIVIVSLSKALHPPKLLTVKNLFLVAAVRGEKYRNKHVNIYFIQSPRFFTLVITALHHYRRSGVARSAYVALRTSHVYCAKVRLVFSRGTT